VFRRPGIGQEVGLPDPPASREQSENRPPALQEGIELTTFGVAIDEVRRERSRGADCHECKFNYM